MAVDLLGKFHSGIVAHLLLAVVHGGDLQNDGQVTAGLDGDGDGGDLQTQDVGGLLVQTQAVVHLALHPCFQIDDEVDALGHLDRAHTEEAANVNNTDSAKP